MNHVLYLYCLVHADRLMPLDGTGVNGGPVFLQRFQDLAAVLSMVSLEEFSGEAAEKNLADLSWVGPRACRHGEVVAEASRFSSVLPVRFGVIFSSPRALERFLESHHGAIRKFLSMVADKEEWSVKGILDRYRAKGAILGVRLSDEEERLAALSPGRRYMEEQKIQGRLEGELNDWLQRACRAVTADLSSHSADFRQRSVLPYDGAGKEIVLNLAFLIPRDATAEFLALIERTNAGYAPLGLSFQPSGPWPPYSFSPALDDAAAPGPAMSPQ